MPADRVPNALFAEELFSVSRRGGGVGRTPEDEAIAVHWTVGSSQGWELESCIGQKPLPYHIRRAEAGLLLCRSCPTTSCTNIYYQAVLL